MRLFTYRVVVDGGAAPNPFWGVCTLAICKPAIRRVVKVGDWVVGFGCKRGPDDRTDRVVYAMRVTDVLSMDAYDRYTFRRLRGKVLDATHRDVRRRVGDSVYDFSTDPPGVRPGVHTEDDRDHDLGGRHVLLSEDFIYWGRDGPRIPRRLAAVVPKGRGHQSSMNEPWLVPFVRWIRSVQRRQRDMVGMPLDWPFDDARVAAASCARLQKHCRDRC